jgi:hypothetical protein
MMLTIIYQTPRGVIEQIGTADSLEAADELKRTKIKSDPEYRKGSWFASATPEKSKSWFRL